MEEAANSKQYESAKVHAEEAVRAAEQARIEGKASALRIKEEAASNISSLRTEIEETSKNVNGARYSQLNLDHTELDRGVKDAYVAMDQAETSMVMERYKDALDRAVNARSSLADINQKITNATPRRK
jgi:helix-turn-helix protein